MEQYTCGLHARIVHLVYIIIGANAQQDNARDYVQGIVKDCVFNDDKDWVLNCILYMLNKDCKLTVNQFDPKTSKEIYDKKDKLKSAITQACTLVKRFGMHERGLTSKLALLPIAWHIYHFNLAGSINKLFKNGQSLSVTSGINVAMRTWLFRAIAKGFFTSGTNFDRLPNLQLLTKAENNSKSDTPLDTWWSGKNDGEKARYLLRRWFDTSLNYFADYFADRKQWLAAILAEKLGATESMYAGENMAEKAIAVAYRQGKHKYAISCTIHDDKHMSLTTSTGEIIIKPVYLAQDVMEFTNLSDEQRQALISENLAEEVFVETRDYPNNTQLRETVFGIKVDPQSDVMGAVQKLFKAIDCLLAK